MSRKLVITNWNDGEWGKVISFEYRLDWRTEIGRINVQGEEEFVTILVWFIGEIDGRIGKKIYKT